MLTSCDGEDPNNIAFDQINFSAPPAKKSKSNIDNICQAEKSCYFSQHRNTKSEIKERPVPSSVSSDCDGGLIPFSELISNTTDCYTEYGARNEADLVLSRGAGEFETNWDDDRLCYHISKRHICEHHRNELSTLWRQTKGHVKIRSSQEACTMPLGVGSAHRTACIVDLKDVTHTEAMAVLFLDGILIHEGIPACRKHKEVLRSRVKDFKDNLSQTPKTNGNDTEISEENVCASATTPRTSRNNNVNYRETPDRIEKSVEARTPPKNRPYFLKPPGPFGDAADDYYCSLMQELNISPYTSHTPWNRMSQRTKNRHIAAFKTVIEKLAVLAVGENDGQKLVEASISSLEYTRNAVAPDESTNECLIEVSKLYFAAESSQERRRILSVVADVYPMKYVEKHITGLTSWSYYEAKKDAVRYKCRQTKPEVPILRPRIKQNELVSFVDFICSDIITVGLPFGNTKSKLPNGSVVEVPSAIRMFRCNEIMAMYKTDMRNRGVEVQISDSTMRRILEACPAKTKTTLDAVDQFKANGLQAFQWMADLIETLLKEEIIDVPTKAKYKAQLTEAEFFLKADFYNLLQLEHFSADLCMNYALSDSNEEAFRSDKCHDPENHHYDIPRAYIFQNLCNRIKEDIQEFAKKGDAIAVQNLEIILAECIAAIDAWREHIIRKRYSDHIRADIFTTLQNGDAFITIDYSQKWLPRKSMESMRDYFGKAGLSMHVMHAVMKRCGEIVQHTVVHFLGHADQDYVAVTAILINGLKLLSENGVVRATIRSDNAAYYHNAALLMSIPEIANKSQVNIKRYSFSEPQAGKSTADVETARLKNVFRSYLKSGKDLLSENDMFDAIDQAIDNRLLSGVTAIAPKNIPPNTDPSTKTLDMMYFIGDVEYSTGDGDPQMRYWKHHGIGAGITKVVTTDDIEDLPIAEFGNDGIRLISTVPFWRTSISAKPSNRQTAAPTIEGPIKTNEEHVDGLFRCCHEGCMMEYLTTDALEQHMLSGNHKLVPERETLQETSYKLYADTMNGMREAHREIMSAISNTGDGEVIGEKAVRAEGWALKKPAKRNRFSEDVKKFLREEYVKQMRQGRKRVNAFTVQENMRSSRKPLFKASERLSSTQIASWYTRYAKEMKKVLANAPSDEPSDQQSRECASAVAVAMETEAGCEFEYRQDPTFSNNHDDEIHSSVEQSVTVDEDGSSEELA